MNNRIEEKETQLNLNNDFMLLYDTVLNGEFEAIGLYHDNYYIGLFAVIKDDKDKYNIKLTFSETSREFRIEIFYHNMLYQTIYFNKYLIYWKKVDTTC